MRKGEKTRQELLKTASQLFRERGNKVRVDEIMANLNLTRGGFYAHFSDKAQLYADAITYAFAEAKNYFVDRDANLGPREWLKRANRRYLNEDHLNNPAKGCVIPSLAGEVNHTDAEAQRAFTAGVRLIVGGLATHAGSRVVAIQALVTWVGAVAVARAVQDPALRAEILAAALARVEQDAAHLP